MSRTFRPPPTWSRPGTDPADRFVGDLVAASTDAPSGIGLLGLPFDGAVLGRKGAREGPAAIRAELYKMKPWWEGREVTTPIRDFGDVVLPDDVAGAHRAAADAAREVAAAGFVPVALGGDHSLTYPLASIWNGRPFGVVNLDAHLDVRDVVGGRINSGTSFGRLLEDGIVPGSRLLVLGTRGFATSPAYHAKLAKHGGASVEASVVARDVEGEAARALARVGGPLYLSVDIDVLDQDAAPGVSAPTPGGLRTRELLRLVAALVHEAAASGGLVAADVVEVAPPLDSDGRTARAAAAVVLVLAASLAEATPR